MVSAGDVLFVSAILRMAITRRAPGAPPPHSPTPQSLPPRRTRSSAAVLIAREGESPVAADHHHLALAVPLHDAAEQDAEMDESPPPVDPLADAHEEAWAPPPPPPTLVERTFRVLERVANLAVGLSTMYLLAGEASRRCRSEMGEGAGADVLTRRWGTLKLSIWLIRW